MMKHCTRFFLPLLLLCLSLVAFALVAGAAVETGSCGDNLTYALDTETGVLTISGTGSMSGYQTMPWEADSVHTLVLEEGVTSICAAAFRDCVNLTSVTLPSSLSYIGFYAFDGCTGLTAVNIADLNHWASFSFAEADANPLTYAHHLYLNGEIVTDLALSDGLYSIGANVFSGGTDFVSLTIPKSVKYINNGAFFGCTNLSEIQIDAENAYFTVENNVLFDRNMTTLICAAPAAAYGSYTVPSTVTSIGEGAFYECKGLSDIVLPTGIKFIGRQAFSGTAWHDAQPDGVVYAGNCAIDYKGVMPVDADIVLADGTVAITDGAFNGQKNMKSIHIPASVTNCGYMAFANCNVQAVYITDIVAWCNIRFGRASGGKSVLDSPLRGAELYLNDKLVTDLVIPDGVSHIGAWAFNGCTSLENISIPASVTSMGSDAFTGTPYVQSQPDGMIYVDKWAVDSKGDFSDSTSLVLKAGTVGIAGSAFTFADWIYDAVIPASVVYIGKYAFESCSNLSDITILNPNCNICDDPGGFPFPDTTTIHGYAGSTAETYAETYGNPFVALQTPVRVTGDADGDGAITVSDALLVLRTLIGGGAADEYTDMNGDGELSLLDIVLILRSINA